MNLRTIHNALISVSDKSGIVEFAKQLQQWNVQIISTGGTLAALRDAGVEARSISEVTGFPEILDGRVKTLHPKIHGALLGIPSNPKHREQLTEFEIEPIDLVVVNLYPFEQTVNKGGVSLDDAVEQIDIGGPTMLRSAAKNFREKTVIVNPARYTSIIEEMKSNRGAVSEATRFALAKEVFLHTSRYDTVISEFFISQNGTSAHHALPEILTISSKKAETLRYGENPHQQAALYGDFLSIFSKLHGKELSYNNIVDIQSAAALAEEFAGPAAVIVKHTNPCGAGSGSTLTDAYDKAFATDTKSAFGGIVAFNRPVTAETARRIDAVFTEVVIAPRFEPDAFDVLKKKKDRRLVEQTSPLASRTRLEIRSVAGGFLAQTPDNVTLAPERLSVVTKRQPTADERSAMTFAWNVAKYVKSNAIVYARSDRTIGIGAGQMSRFDSSKIAVLKAREMGLDLAGTAVASDAFFPFADGLLEAVDAGATAVIQPGGSIRDEEVIAAANAHNIAMIFTGIRHFKH
jgi:phosphoribosylaminoimidazolecarboxamide formyltransferase/IMP cyclohydrolase